MCAYCVLRGRVWLVHFVVVSYIGREDERIEFIQTYLKANKMFRDYNNPEEDPVYTEVSSFMFLFLIMFTFFPDPP